MAIESHVITEQQATAILASHEGHFIDLKAKEIEPAKLSRHLSAFANADGGEVYVGISEDKLSRTFSWVGASTFEDWNAHIQVIESLFPLGADAYCEFLECKELPGVVLKVSISKSSSVKRATNDVPYVRRGAQSLPCDSYDKVKRLEYTKGISTFEDEILDCDVSIIENSEAVIKFMLDVVPSSEPSMWLRKQRLIIKDKPCCAGVLLFSDEPQAILPKRSGIKLYRYKTSEDSGSRDTLEFDPITVDGCVYDQIYSAVDSVKKMIDESKILGDGVLESVKYPPETLHEVITNAVLHRDYSLADDVHIRIFDNRVEVESPGKLPAHITVKNILEERFARNCKVVRLINKFPNPPNKDVGEGLNTAFEAMRKLNLRDPIINEKDNSVLVVIRHEPLASPEEVILEYFKFNTEINNSKARAICYIGSENKMKRVFEKMISHGLIERIPERRGRATAYRIKN